MLNQEVRVHILCLDIVQGAIDASSLTDYLKQNYKKEVAFLNGLDYADSAGRASKVDQKKDKSTKYDTNTAIARAIKSKIESEMAKISDAKKKALAAYEKQKAAVQSGKGKTKHFEELSKFDYPFEGTIDCLFILNNFPYLPNQLTPLSEIDIPVSFICIVPKGGARPMTYTKRNPNEKSARQAGKKTSIAGSEMDSLANPKVYPPTRWLTLRPTAPAVIPFREIEAGDDAEATFKRLEQEIIRINHAREDYIARFSDRTFITLPDVNPVIDMTQITEYLRERPGDFINAMYFTLKTNNWTPKSPDTAKSIEEEYMALFSAGREVVNRSVIFQKNKELPDADFDLKMAGSAASLLHRVSHWKLDPEHALSCVSVNRFLQVPSNFYAYAGQKFDQLFTSINKKYQLGLPVSFFDWSKWDLSTDYQHIGAALAGALHTAGVVETIMDEQIGVLWVMTLPPTPRTYGHFLTKYSIPQTMNGFTDFIDYLFEKSGETEKRSRNPPSPAQIIRENGDFSILMPPLTEKVAQAQTIYGLPLECSNSAEFTSPYCFPSGLKVNVHRNVINGKPDFGYKANYKNILEVSANGQSIMMCPSEGVRVMIEYPLVITLLYSEQSLRYDEEKIIIKTTSENPIIVTKTGAFVIPGPDNKKMIVMPNGAIGKYQDGQWSYCMSDCTSYVKTIDGMKPVESRHTRIDDIANGTTSVVRPDDIEYYIKDDGTHRILLGEDFSIEQSQDKGIYDIPGFPVLLREGTTFVIGVDIYEISFDKQTAKITCDDYTVEITPEKAVFVFPDCEMSLSPSRGEFKSGNNILVADENGTERMTMLGEIPQKKKIEVFDTHWGKTLPIKETLTEAQQLELHQKFVPRFFAIRGDLSGAEFVRSDTILMDGVTTKENKLPHPSGEDCEIISYHHETKMPMIYMKNKTLTKAARSAVLKGLHVAKPKKKKGAENDLSEEVIMEAEGARDSYICDSKMFNVALTTRLEQNERQYVEEITPPPPPPAEKLPIPPPTPAPRILEMQACAYQKKVGDCNSGAVLNYWLCHESEFAMPMEEARSLPRPLSPRVALFDPPKPQVPEKADYPVVEPPLPRIVRSPGPIRTSSCVATSKSRPLTVKATPDIINFGTVKAYTPAVASLTVTNTGTKPLHFSCSQTNNKLLKVLTIPGVVFPGLKMTLKVALEPAEPQYISTSFTLTTKETREQAYEMKIPIIVTIVE